jgi:predicted phosphodiesterase
MWYPPTYQIDDNSETILVLAGDICSEESLLYPYLANLCDEYWKVVFVLGNHEFYGKDILNFIADVHQFQMYRKLDNLHILDNDYEIFVDSRGNHVRIIGSTLWTDFNNHPVDMAACESGISDFRLIRTNDSSNTSMSANTMQFLFNESLLFIEDTLECNYDVEDFEGETIVVTHFPPSPMCAAPYRGPSNFSSYFTPKVPEALFSVPTYWIYGHTHDKVDCEIMGCKIVTNPVGYPGELVNDEYNILPRFIHIGGNNEQ